MQRDLTADRGSGEEIAFVERFWTDVWRRQGDPRRRLNRVARQPEYAVLRRYLPPPGRDVAVLDGGCGLGEWTVHLARLGYRAIGLDVSRETVATLTRLFPDAEFAVRDIRDTGLPDASIAVYFSWGVFEHFEEGLQRCIAEARRVLRPGGTLVISVPFDNLRQRWLRRGKPPAGTVPEGMRFYQWRLTREELRDELARAGFAVDEVRPIHTRGGVMRSLHHELGLPYGKVNAAAAALLAPLLPARVFAHMLLAAARKPAT